MEGAFEEVILEGTLWMWNLIKLGKVEQCNSMSQGTTTQLTFGRGSDAEP